MMRLARRYILAVLTAVLTVWASLAQIAPGVFQLQGSTSKLSWILDPRVAWGFFPIVAILLALILSRLDQSLLSLETEKRDLRRELLESLRADILRYQAEAISIATIREARVRIDIRDYNGAIRAGDVPVPVEFEN